MLTISIWGLNSICLGFEFYMSGYPTNNAIWLFWNSDVHVHDVTIASQSISLT